MDTTAQNLVNLQITLTILDIAYSDYIIKPIRWSRGTQILIA